MKQRFILALSLVLSFCAAIAFTGCETDLGTTADTIAFNTRRTAADPVRVTGALAIIDGKPAVLYQGNVYFITGWVPSAITGSASLTVTGETVPLLDRDDAGNSLFLGYSLHAETVTVN
jgi:hypothetical protein